MIEMPRNIEIIELPSESLGREAILQALPAGRKAVLLVMSDKDYRCIGKFKLDKPLAVRVAEIDQIPILVIDARIFWCQDKWLLGHIPE